MSAERISELEARLEATQIELETQAHNFAVDKARDLREINRLKREIGRGAGVTDDEKLLRRLFDLWLSLRAPSNGRTPAMTDDRIKALRWLVKHYEADGAEKAIRASAKYRFLVYGKWQATGDYRDRRDDLTDFAGNANRTEQLIDLADGIVPAAPNEPPPRRSRLAEHFDPVHELSEAMRRAGKKMRGHPTNPDRFVGQCPAHDDTNPSLSIALSHGQVLLYCHAGCSTKAVIDALGLDWCDLFVPDFERKQTVESFPPPPEGRHEFDQLGIDWSAA